MTFLGPYKIHSQLKSIIFVSCFARLNLTNLYLHTFRFCTSKTAIKFLRILIIQQSLFILLGVRSAGENRMSVKILVLAVHMYENGIFSVFVIFLHFFVGAYIIAEETAHYFFLKFCTKLGIDKVNKLTLLKFSKKS